MISRRALFSALASVATAFGFGKETAGHKYFGSTPRPGGILSRPGLPTELILDARGPNGPRLAALLGSARICVNGIADKEIFYANLTAQTARTYDVLGDGRVRYVGPREASYQPCTYPRQENAFNYGAQIYELFPDGPPANVFVDDRGILYKELSGRIEIWNKDGVKIL